MSDENQTAEILAGSWSAKGQFVNDAGEEIGTFDGILAVDGAMLSGHGHGAYKPPENSKITFVSDRVLPVAIDTAHIRHGLITFQAWLLHQ